MALACTLLANLAWIDLRSSLLPDALTYPLLWLGIVASWAGLGISLPQAIGGVVAGYLFLYLCAAILRSMAGRDVVGGGDVKLLAGLGAWLGAGWLTWGLLAACLAGVDRKSTRLHSRH